MKWFAALVLLVAACAAEAPFPSDVERIRIATDTTEIALGRGFPLTVTRVWEKGRPPGEWSDDRLFPLFVTPIGTERSEAGGKVAEVRRFTAYAFDPGELVIPPPELVPDAAERLALTVRPVLDAASPGEPELPGGLFTESPAWWPWLLGVAALGAIGIGLRFRARLPAPVPEPSAPAGPPPPSPSRRALDRLAALRGLSPEGRAATQKWYVEATTAVREYVAERFAVPASNLTTPECIAAVAAVGDEASLRRFLVHGDGVKFARERPDDEERSRRLDDAEAFIRDTAGGAA